MSRREDSGDTRGERREQKQRKKRGGLRMHGASLRRVYRDAVVKRLRRGRAKEQPDASDDKRGS